MVIAQPTGTVTLLFSDVEGSTRLLETLGTERYAEALDLHRRLLRKAFEAHDGYEVDEEGDALLVAFGGAGDGVAAAAEAQQALAAADWPEGVAVRVRIGVHSGEPLAGPPKYVGMDVHRAARIMGAAPKPRPPCIVPKVKGKSLRVARRNIKRAHCRTGTIKHGYSKIKRGHVISQRPRPMRHLHNGANVNLVISEGRRP